MYQNYIFDLYGTLADTHTNENKHYLWNKLSAFFSAYGAIYKPLELKKAYFRLVKEEEAKQTIPNAEIKLDGVFEQLFSDKGITPDRHLIEAVGNIMRILSRDYICLYDGVMEFLLDLKKKGKGIYLLSNAQRLFTENELKVLEIYDLFDGIYISSDKGVKKPSPKFMEMLLEEYHLDKSKSIMIGNDCSSDIAVANACGMDSLFIHANISPPLPKEIPATYAILDGDFRKVAPLILK